MDTDLPVMQAMIDLLNGDNPHHDDDVDVDEIAVTR